MNSGRSGAFGSKVYDYFVNPQLIHAMVLASRKATPDLWDLSAFWALACCCAVRRSVVGDLLIFITLALGAACFVWESCAAVVNT